MLKFYFHPSPNPAKVALLLQEAGIAYELMPVDTSKGEQHLPAFRAINPNGRSRRSSIGMGRAAKSSAMTTLGVPSAV